MTTTRLHAEIESFPIAGRFTISRGSKTEARVIRVELEQHGLVGQGECVPYARYGETLEKTLETIQNLAPQLASGLDRAGLQTALPPGAARNAVDCAFWDLEAKRAGTDVAKLANVRPPARIETAYTISLDTPEAMAEAALRHAHMPLLKLKLGAPGDADRLAAIRAAVPNTRLVVDANEGWHPDELQTLLRASFDAGIELVEQPLPAGNDAPLAEIEHTVPICADESAHALAGLEALVGRYDAVNVKLDKTGGLTEALAVAKRAKELDLSIMVGCMVSTSLSMAPASLLAPFARWVDLDGPLLLVADRPNGLAYTDGAIDPTVNRLWGRYA
ncbi:mandelate racemase [Devosia sp. Root685]|uniref:N-acetyl-D-Glu racemase DgcA n=1 Tax=Devosia sp. Root685 TaxID=1736587 RepID=UPI0006F67E69|nr:N-acetyl-D-Glu racemase DgcA [Devosia sp. Root685]KRA97710.1 mandelate racemase [Devosia sp. Root685]